MCQVLSVDLSHKPITSMERSFHHLDGPQIGSGGLNQIQVGSGDFKVNKSRWRRPITVFFSIKLRQIREMCRGRRGREGLHMA